MRKDVLRVDLKEKAVDVVLCVALFPADLGRDDTEWITSVCLIQLFEVTRHLVALRACRRLRPPCRHFLH